MADTSTSVTNASAFQQGSLGKQVLFFIITFGLYGIFWWYKTNEQFSEGTNADLDPTIQTVLFLIPPISLYAIWKFSSAAEDVIGQSAIVLLLLSMVFPPAFWFLVQSGINDLA